MINFRCYFDAQIHRNYETRKKNGRIIWQQQKNGTEEWTKFPPRANQKGI